MSLKVEGNNVLRGPVYVSGCKNSCLPILAATTLSAGKYAISNVPAILDVSAMCSILQYIGADIDFLSDRLVIETTSVKVKDIPRDLGSTLRGSVLLLGPLLARFGYAKIPLPGGCQLGARPIDQHIKALSALGADFSLDGEFLVAKASKGLHSGRVIFDVPTVTGTANVLMAAAGIPGTTMLYGAAREPEIADLAIALVSMGVIVEGAGTSHIKVCGTLHMHSFSHRLMPDRIECGTFLVAGSLVGDPLIIVGGIPSHQEALIQKLLELGTNILIDDDRMIVYRTARPSPISIETGPYPGIPTDMQAPIMTLLSTIPGTSSVIENVYEERFRHVHELTRMGAQIHLNGNTATITGVTKLFGATVNATDLRAGAALVLAGLVSEGETTVREAYNIDRGYENIEGKLRGVGAHIHRKANENL
ncbi:hypothetical protein B7463_g9550, partial [Scytalidium lignicola]